jgi:hypothetical protein
LIYGRKQALKTGLCSPINVNGEGARSPGDALHNASAFAEEEKP